MEMELKQILQTFWRWRRPMIAVVGTTMLALVLATILAEPEYQARVKMQVTTPEQENVALFDETRYVTEREAVVIALNNFQVILESEQVRNDTIEELGLAEIDQDYQLDIVPIRDTDFLDIVILARSPKLAADIANTHSQAAIVRMGELSAIRSREAKNYLARQLEEAKEEMNQAEDELKTFQTENGIIDLSSALEDSQLLLQQLELERNRILYEEADSKTDLVAPIELLIKQRRDELEPLLFTRSMHTELVGDVTLADETFQAAGEAYQTVLEQFPGIDVDDPPEAVLEAEATVQEADSALKSAKSALTTFLLKNDMVALESEISMLQNQIEQLSLERDRQMLSANDQRASQMAMITSISYLIAEREVEIDSLRALAPRFNLLSMNVEQARDRYELVISKYNEADIKADALQTADFLQVVSAAEPPESAESNDKKLLVFGLAGGIGFAVLLAFLLEYLQEFQSETESFNMPTVSRSLSHSTPTSSEDEIEGELAV